MDLRCEAPWKATLGAWGIPYLFPYQELVIQRILEAPEGRRAVILPTGAGKSLCFQLPAAHLPHPTLVVYPLRSLMADQARRLGRLGLEAAVLQGGQTRAQRQEFWQGLEAGRWRLVLTNPEILEVDRTRQRLAQHPWSHLVVDEAHCTELWGASFRPSYARLADHLEALAAPRWTAFTATATEDLAGAWARGLFRGQGFELIRASADRTNLHWGEEPYLALRTALPRVVLRERRPTVVFCRSREKVRRWAHHLARTAGVPVRFYHAGLSRDEKAAVEAWFLDSTDGVLVATNAYGLGVDKPNIRTVVHLEPPPGPEDHLQEAGRAGRDGQPARALVLVPSRPGGGATACLRGRLLAAFGEDSEVPSGPGCSGCDVCAGLSRRPPREVDEAWARLGPLVHRADEAEVRDFLAGRAEPRLWLSDLRTRRGWGLWADHDDLTVRDLWRGLREGGWVRFEDRGLWKGLLAPPPAEVRPS